MRVRARRAAIAALAGVLVAVPMVATASGPNVGVPVANGLDPCKPVLACGPDVDAAVALETRIDDHFFWGQVVESEFRTAEKLPGDVASVGGWGDSGLWTGTYLAAESFRYATAQRHLARRHTDETQRAFWQAQLDQSVPRIEAMVAKYHLLTNIAAQWRTELAPSTDPPSFGGGVIQGEPGMLMRACAPVDAPPSSAMGRNKRVFGPWRWEDGRDYLCETAPSRDTYAGTTFGLLNAFDLVGADRPDLQAQIRDDILTMAGFLVKYGWNYPRPHGNISAPPTGHDFDNFASPLFVYVPLARLNMAQAARHVATVAGSPAERAKWDAVWAEEVATQLPLLAASMEVDAVQPQEGYYKYNLHHLTGHSLTRLERDPVLRAAFLQAMGVMDRTTGDDVNAHFETITFAMTGEARRRDLAVTHLLEWRTYRERISAGGVTDNASKCGVSIECVPKDQYDVLVGPDGDEVDVLVPGTSTSMRARLPLPVADRPPTDFLWQRPPTQLNGSTSATHEAPGVDYLLPYWMLRYLGEVDEPTLAPFPPYPGPAHQ